MPPPTAANDARAAPLPWPALLLVALAALAARLAVQDRTNLDLIDHFLPWLEDIRAHGLWTAISRPYSRWGYTPFWSYAVGLADAILPAGTDGKTVIKTVSIAFDFVAAGIVVAIARLRWPASRTAAVIAFAAVLFAPTVLLNGAYWGQSDIVYTAFLLACVYALLRQAPVAAMLAFGMAAAIKLQAMWLAPLILAMVLSGRIRWWLLGLVPLVYFALALPAAIAGRSVLEVTSIYFTQAGTQNSLASSVSNLQFFPQYFFIRRGLWPDAIPLFSKLSVLVTAGLCLVFAWRSSRGPMNAETLLLAALTSVLIPPLLLPFMHNRYFFPADLLAIALAIWRPALWPVALLMQFSSFVSYVSFLWGREMLASPVPPWLAIFGFTNNLQPVTGLEALSGLLNAVLLAWCWRRLARSRSPARAVDRHRDAAAPVFGSSHS
jgi:Gpi18-like mannosyltransferase